MTNPGLLRGATLPLVIGLSLTGCLIDSPPPNVGTCADYPDGHYEFGDIGIGTCLGGPVDLKVYQGPEGDALLVVNSNAFLTFTGSSLLSLDLDAVVARLDELRAEQGLPADGALPFPVILLTSDPELRASSIAMPDYSGRVAIGAVPSPDGNGPEQPVAFVSNRLSVTTDDYAPSYLYAFDLADPFALVEFDLNDGSAPVEEGSSSLLLGDDPFGMTFAETPKGRFLYVVNESDNAVQVLDASHYPIRPMSSSKVALVADPSFSNAGSPSFAELTELAVDPEIYSLRWTLGYVEGTYRAWYVGRGEESGALGFADSGDGMQFVTRSASPILEAGEAEDWDALGIGRVSVVISGTSGEDYFVFYEGFYRDPQGVVRGRIGLARTAEADVPSPLVLYPFDVDGTSSRGEDYLIGVGEAGSFTEYGAGRPYVSVRGEEQLNMWFTGTDAAGRRSLGFSSANQGTITQWATPVQLEIRRYEQQGGEVVTVADTAEALDPAGFYDSRLERYRLWYVREEEGTSCLAYAESSDGATYVLGGVDREEPALSEAAACLELGLDPVADAVIRSPSLDAEGSLLRLFFVTAPTTDAVEWRMHQARGFDGIDWESAGEGVPFDGGYDWEGGEPAPFVLKLTEGSARLTAENTTLDVPAIPLNELIDNRIVGRDPENPTELINLLYFSVVHGHTLGVTARERVTSNDGTLADAAWDSLAVGEPGIDPVDGTLYYTGYDLSSRTSIGVAARDGEQYRWLNAAEPLLSDPAVSIFAPEIVHHGGTTWLYYTVSATNGDSRPAIRVVTRPEGADDWEVAGAVTAVSATELELGVAAPSVVPPSTSGGRWHMWFTALVGAERRIAYAWSIDGVSWTRAADDVAGDPVYALAPGSGGDWDDAAVEGPDVVRGADGVYRMWYTGSDGSVNRIGLATATPSQGRTEETMVWTRWQDPVSTRSEPVLVNDTSPVLWDASGVSHPSVTQDGDGTWWMWYQGLRGSVLRVGTARSLDGIHWLKVYEPLTVGDYFTFETRQVREGTEGDAGGGEPAGLVDGAISLEREIGGASFYGYGATEIAMAPDQSIAVVSARATAGVYVIDTRDDSSLEPNAFDANFLNLEAVISLQNVVSNVQQGTRSVMFSQDGSRIYMTTVQPESLLIFDRTAIEDTAVTRLLTEDVLLGSIPLEPGIREDEGVQTGIYADVGPIGLAMSADGRYLWVANANANSVYTIDLSLGAYGQVVAEAQDVGELPVALTLSPDGRYLFVANYVGEVQISSDDRQVVHGTLAVVDADPTSPTFGRTVGKIKNLEL